MDRREMLTTAGAAAAAGLVLAGNASGDDRRRSNSPKAMSRSSMHEECLDKCQQCETICNETAHHCLTQAGNGLKDHVRAAEIALTCEEFCGLAAKLIARSCDMTMDTCQLCAKVCEACAKECEKIDSDKQMMACAKACRECAATCRKMA